MSALAGVRVLIVEDEFILARQMSRALVEQGAEVIAAAPSVAAALSCLAAGPAPDVAVLDVNLAGEPVYPVADALALRAIPFLFASGYDPEERDPRHRDAPHLQKPLVLMALVRRLAALVGRG
ncbi:response regulator [Sphingomonas morindae]|uniref:Response regulator n=1 Tax=Sphingomonas morindae TaxID=1541170 RepID=A0ABY4XCX9_9SPHN|nr:response regulator [Sphingomonas morindae]USI74763.1 response regulator [Sphingomonas morindae]